MSSIKQKKGVCLDCDNGMEVPLIAGRCKTHYWRHRQKVNQQKKNNSVKSKTVKKKDAELEKWFEIQITQIPNTCENCDESLDYHKWKHPRWLIAHILAKRKTAFPEVKTHPLNRLFLCPDCHNNFDNGGKDIVKMKCFRIAIKRLSKVIEWLPENRRVLLPEVFLKNLNIENENC